MIYLINTLLLIIAIVMIFSDSIRASRIKGKIGNPEIVEHTPGLIQLLKSSSFFNMLALVLGLILIAIPSKSHWVFLVCPLAVMMQTLSWHIDWKIDQALTAQQ